MSYTPGPWSVPLEGRIRGGALEYLWYIEDYGNGVPDPARREADARLIAAAPELLEALDNAHGILQVNLGDVDPHVRAACDLMWTAITKAKGES